MQYIENIGTISSSIAQIIMIHSEANSTDRFFAQKHNETDDWWKENQSTVIGHVTSTSREYPFPLNTR